MLLWWSCRVTIVFSLGNVPASRHARSGLSKTQTATGCSRPLGAVLGARHPKTKPQLKTEVFFLVELPGTAPGSVGV